MSKYLPLMVAALLGLALALIIQNAQIINMLKAGTDSCEVAR